MFRHTPTKGFIPSQAEIEAALEERFNLFYFLTQQGGERWESVSKPKWQQYRSWVGDEFEGELTCADREIAERALALNHLLPGGNCRSYIIPETIVWQTLSPWQATYWKMLPVGYKVRYQCRVVEIDEDAAQPQERIEQEIQVKEWYCSTGKWYTNYYKPLYKHTVVKNAEYLILLAAGESNNCTLKDLVSLKDVVSVFRISQAKAVIAADALFQSGDIRARVFADDEDTEGTPNVVLTLAGIQDHLDGRIRASYYLTPQGGARWKAMAHPD